MYSLVLTACVRYACVVFCFFFFAGELDEDHDGYIDAHDLIQYDDYALTNKVVDRVMAGAGRKLLSPIPGKMNYLDFVIFLISEVDKNNDVALDYCQNHTRFVISDALVLLVHGSSLMCFSLSPLCSIHQGSTSLIWIVMVNEAGSSCCRCIFTLPPCADAVARCVVC